MATTERKETRIRLRPDVNMALDYYIAEQNTDVENVPGLRLDRNTVVSDVMAEYLKTKGHYGGS